MLTLLPTLALAAAPDDDALRKALGAKAGREVPADLFCVDRPALAAPFTGDPTPVGVQMKGTGCKLFAVSVHGALVDPAAALPASVPGWAALPAADRAAAAQTWVRDVLLAFDQPTDGGSGQTSGGALTVSQPFLQRVAPNVARETPGSFTFDASGALTKSSRDGGQLWKSELQLKFAGGVGVTQEQALIGVEALGKVLHQCVHDAWAVDHALEDRTRFAWDIAGGTSAKVSAKGQPPEALMSCYGSVLNRLAYPPELTGHVEWTFAVVRTPVAE